jgi:hypothetical protein
MVVYHKAAIELQFGTHLFFHGYLNAARILFLTMDEGASVSTKDTTTNESDAFQKCGRRGRRGACTNNELPVEKLADFIGSLKLSEKEDSSKNSTKKPQGT